MSAFQRTIPLATINGVASPGRATIDVPTDLRFHTIILEYRENGVAVTQANMEAAISKINVKLDGTSQREFSAAQLNVMNGFRGAAYAYQNGLLFLHFAEPWLKRIEEQHAMAWSLQGNASTFQIEVDIVAGRTSPTLTAMAVVDSVVSPLIMRKTRLMNIAVTAAGVRTEANLPKQLGDYAMLHCFETTANDITAAKVFVDQQLAYDRSRFRNNAVLLTRSYVPSAAVFHLNFEEDRSFMMPLPMRKRDRQTVGEFRLELTMAQAQSVNILAEIIGPRD
ncbi:major capsid protein P2 [Parvibaculum sp.]|uniref:major capsid protein P2 n=1 Tax=Parvibaculum sp. TaxID=2024848 RepID=UPI0026159241|nr:major capsid protein P2 [Parvibaculum sp.]MCW5728148.1 hypothetical protein [Parvibaculum sp.]